MNKTAAELTEADHARIAKNREEAIKRRAEREMQRQQENRNPTAQQCQKPSAESSIRPVAPIFRKDVPRLDPSCVIRTNKGPISSHGPPASDRFGRSAAAAVNDQRTLAAGSARAAPPDSKTLVNVTFNAVDPQRFKIVFLPFHMDVVDALKKDYAMTKKVLNLLQTVKIVISDIPDCVIKAFENLKKNASQVDNDTMVKKVGNTLYEKLFPYQREGLKFGIEKNGRVMIADEMGLGKSIQALAVAKYYQNEWPLLIVCPSSVKFSWKDQIAKFMPSLSPDDVCVIDKSKDLLPISKSANTVVIISYDLLNLKLKQITDYKFYVLIFDECHVLKDSKTKRATSATELGKIARRTILLSGTPALSRPAELFSQLRVIDPKLFPNYRNFAERYCDGREGRYGYEAKGASNTDELASVLFSCIMIRRLKKNLLHELPSKIREIVYLSGDALVRELNNLKKSKEAFEAAMHADKTEKERSMIEFYAQTGCAKAKAVSNHVIEKYFDEAEEPRKVIVFAHHQMVLDTLCFHIRKRGLKYIRIDGTTKNREEQCRLFQEDNDYVVAVLSITAAGAGITLTAATVVIFAELHWNPGTLMQAEDRAHRVGQKDSVFVQYLLARGTADDFIWPLVQKKLAVLGSVNLSSDNFRNTASSSVHVTSESDITRCSAAMSTHTEGSEHTVPDPRESVEDPENVSSFEYYRLMEAQFCAFNASLCVSAQVPDGMPSFDFNSWYLQNEIANLNSPVYTKKEVTTETSQADAEKEEEKMEISSVSISLPTSPAPSNEESEPLKRSEGNSERKVSIASSLPSLISQSSEVSSESNMDDEWIEVKPKKNRMQYRALEEENTRKTFDWRGREIAKRVEGGC
ncbi:hypothetical protein QR680_012719 [Steinernema hermaphroditum]|uniref:SWI/SNF-related matrix-associated actin-dependent regulator of chromatin subfamily A-like protein 1 n=1 Tax=Steinernema hermaphroditum TaxID=289476 RepID=A0AA39M178_9BILA|nr:hypothetical protein QR680_012719 [Steinernema hermaphroditum]